jgi:phosphoesterase RecJ-like protein
VSPDGDCIGSQLSLAAALRSLGKRAMCVLARDEDIEFGLRTLPGAGSLIPAVQVEGPIGTFVTVDVPSADRLGDAAALHSRAARTITIDHHLSRKPLSQANYIDSEAPACAMIVWKLLPYLGVEPDRTMATCCFTGLSTDTGSFRYQNTTSEAFRLAGEMVAAGADPAQVAADVYQSRSFASLKLERLMLSRIHAHARGQVVVSYTTLDDYRRTGAEKIDAAPLIDTLRSVRGVRVACMLREQEGCVRGSLRAKDGTDVASIARRLGGGGHRAAAGFTVHGTLQEALDAVIAELARL